MPQKQLFLLVPLQYTTEIHDCSLKKYIKYAIYKGDVEFSLAYGI